jgi:hypothetical protein
VLLYLALFNLFPLVTYCGLFIQLRDDFYFWDLILAACSVMITLYAFSNYVFRPSIVGFFRGAFRAFGDSCEDTVPGSGLQNCFTHRLFQDALGEFYNRYTASYYYIFIAYLLASSLVIALELPARRVILVVLQSLVLLVLLAAKPYFNKLEKARSIFTFAILLLSNFLSLEVGGVYTLPLMLLGLCCLHFLLVAVVLMSSFVEQMRRKWNDRGEVLRRMFKVEEQMMANNNS